MKKKFLQQVINHLNEQIKRNQPGRCLCDLFIYGTNDDNVITKLPNHLQYHKLLKERLHKEFPEMNAQFWQPYFPFTVEGHKMRIKFVEKWISELEQQEGGSVA